MSYLVLHSVVPVGMQLPRYAMAYLYNVQIICGDGLSRLLLEEVEKAIGVSCAVQLPRDLLFPSLWQPTTSAAALDRHVHTLSKYM